MVAKPGVHVTGLRDVVRSMEKFGVAAADLKAAFRRIGTVVASEAKSLAPHLTGRLAASIRPSNTKNKSVVKAGGARVPYAGVIHFGGYHGIKAQPFMYDAVEKKQGEAARLLESELGNLIRQLDLK
jgi:HK97 gp10 family phage protein